MNAAQISFAERALLEDDNKLLIEQNNEAKRRRSTKSTVLGRAKVMSYEDLEGGASEACCERSGDEQRRARPEAEKALGRGNDG